MFIITFNKGLDLIQTKRLINGHSELTVNANLTLRTNVFKLLVNVCVPAGV